MDEGIHVWIDEPGPLWWRAYAEGFIHGDLIVGEGEAKSQHQAEQRALDDFRAKRLAARRRVRAERAGNCG
jgi:hypothetical protein